MEDKALKPETCVYPTSVNPGDFPSDPLDKKRTLLLSQLKRRVSTFAPSGARIGLTLSDFADLHGNGTSTKVVF